MRTLVSQCVRIRLFVYGSTTWGMKLSAVCLRRTGIYQRLLRSAVTEIGVNWSGTPIWNRKTYLRNLFDSQGSWLLFIYACLAFCVVPCYVICNVFCIEQVSFTKPCILNWKVWAVQIRMRPTPKSLLTFMQLEHPPKFYWSYMLLSYSRSPRTIWVKI